MAGTRCDNAGHGEQPGAAALEQLPVTQLEQQHLRLMLGHHTCAVLMAAYAGAHATSPDVVRPARAMEQGQLAEIASMQGMLASRGSHRRQPVVSYR